MAHHRTPRPNRIEPNQRGDHRWRGGETGSGRKGRGDEELTRRRGRGVGFWPAGGGDRGRVRGRGRRGLGTGGESLLGFGWLTRVWWPGGEEMETKRDGTRRAGERETRAGTEGGRAGAGANRRAIGWVSGWRWPLGLRSRAGLLRSACGGGGTARAFLRGRGSDGKGAPATARSSNFFLFSLLYIFFLEIT